MKSWECIPGLVSNLETLHRLKALLRFCKRSLELSDKASNVACKAELGRFSLIIAINQKIINYTLCYEDV